jgi:hypothetical protein
MNRVIEIESDNTTFMILHHKEVGRRFKCEVPDCHGKRFYKMVSEKVRAYDFSYRLDGNNLVLTTDVGKFVDYYQIVCPEYTMGIDEILIEINKMPNAEDVLKLFKMMQNRIEKLEKINAELEEKNESLTSELEFEIRRSRHMDYSWGDFTHDDPY